MSKSGPACGGVEIGECTVQRLLFADDLVLLDSSQNSLQQALDRFSDACVVAGMKISATKTETMCLSRQPKQCSLQISRVYTVRENQGKHIFFGMVREFNEKVREKLEKAREFFEKFVPPINQDP